MGKSLIDDFFKSIQDMFTYRSGVIENPNHRHFSDYVTPTPPQSPAKILGNTITKGKGNVPTATPRPTATPTPVPQVSTSLSNYQVPSDYQKRIEGVFNGLNRNASSYFPIYNYIPELIAREQKYQRPGLAALLALQALYESTGGARSQNYFGIKPGGNVSQGFKSFNDALNYQLSENVLGGGANRNMNILGRTGPLTTADITNLYRSYDPPGAYLRPLLDYYSGITGIY